MNIRDKKRLQINSRELINNLIVGDVQDYLYEREVLTPDNVEALSNESSSQKAARMLVVSLLPRKGPDAFTAFCDALREAQYDYLADKLVKTSVAEVEQVSAVVACAETGCKHERNKLLKTSRNLEDELEELKVKVKNISKVKNKVDELEYENFVLKKQLSFYEEKQEVRIGSGHSRNVCKSRSTGSFSVDSNSSTGSEAQSRSRTCTHSKRNSFGGFGTGSGMHVGHGFHRSGPVEFGHEVDEDTNEGYDDSFHDELDDECADGVFHSSFNDDLDSACLDNVDGPTSPRSQCPDNSPTSSGATSSHTCRHSPRSKRRQSQRLSESNQSELSFLLTEDILDYFFSGSKKKPADLDQTFAQYILVMRRAVDSMTDKHGSLIEQISRLVDITASWQEMIERLRRVFEDFLADEFHHSSLFWGRTVAIYALAGFIARKCNRRHKDVQPLREFLTDFVNVRLAKKIQRVGGWVCSYTNLAYIHTCTYM